MRWCRMHSIAPKPQFSHTQTKQGNLGSHEGHPFTDPHAVSAKKTQCLYFTTKTPQIYFLEPITEPSSIQSTFLLLLLLLLLLPLRLLLHSQGSLEGLLPEWLC